MTTKPFTPEELEVLYQIIKDYQENVPEGGEEYYNEYYHEYANSISKKIIFSILRKVAQQLPLKAKEEIDKDFLRQKYHPYNNQIGEKVYPALKKALEQLKTVEISYLTWIVQNTKKEKLMFITLQPNILLATVISEKRWGNSEQAELHLPN